MKHPKNCRILLLCLTILWMAFIFYMSSRNDDDSKAQSSAVCEFLCEIFVEDYAELPPAQRIEMQKRISFPVRKGAHLTEYMVLGILLTLTAASLMTAGGGSGSRRSENRCGERDGESDRGAGNAPMHIPNAPALEKAASHALAIGLLYAVSDEIHQVFVPGRAGQLRDILIDTAGVLIGTCLVRAAGRLLRKCDKGTGTMSH